MQTKKFELTNAKVYELGPSFIDHKLTLVQKEGDSLPADINSNDYVLNPVNGNLLINTEHTSGQLIFVQAEKLN